LVDLEECCHLKNELFGVLFKSSWLRCGLGRVEDCELIHSVCWLFFAIRKPSGEVTLLTSTIFTLMTSFLTWQRTMKQCIRCQILQ